MRHNPIFMIFLFLLLLVAACNQSASPTADPMLHIRLLSVEGGIRAETLSVQLHDAEDAPITDAAVTLEGNMNHAGMVPIVTEAVHDGDDGTVDGVYQLPFQFSMLGDWIVSVTVELADGELVTKDIAVTVAEDGLHIDEADMAHLEMDHTAMDRTMTAADGQMTVHDAMIRAVPMAGMNGALYFTLMNESGESDRLLAVEVASDMAEAAELHESINDNNVMRMEPRPDGFDVPAGGMLELAPGGKHVMLVKLARPLAEGETISATLHFARAEPITLTVAIIPLGSDGEGEHDHGE